MKNYKKMASLLLLCCLLAACAKTTQTMQMKNPQYYPQCYKPLEYLQNRSGKTRAVATGAAQGAAITGLSSLIIGFITGRIDPLGVVGSVGAGAAVGGTIGGISHGNKEDTRQMHAYLEEIDGDITNIDTVEEAAAMVSGQCYTKAFNSLLEEMKHEQMPPSEAQSRYAEIMAGMADARSYYKEAGNPEIMQQEFANAKSETPAK